MSTSKTIFAKKNVLVTGGAGFIGSHLCEELVKKNKVICLDNFITGDEKNIDHLLQLPDFRFINHNLVQPIDLDELKELADFKVKFQGLQEIYHLACPTSPKDFKKHRIEMLLANSLALKNSLDLVVKYKAKFLHFSSSVIYGSRTKDGLTVSEDFLGSLDPVSERSAYDEGKRFAESLVMNYRDFYNIDAKIIRVFRTYGPRMKLGVGHMLPDFIESALKNQDLVIYGDENFSTSLCYVTDVIDGALRIMKTKEAGPINLGGPDCYKLTKIAEKIIKYVGSSSKVKFEEPLLFMTPLPLPDITLAKEKLGWLPIINLDKGLEKTIDYVRASTSLLGF